MSLCINPRCPHPPNPDNLLFCQSCGSEILILGRYRVTKLLSGETGFGRIYEIREKGSGILKILKVLSQNNPKAIDLFQQEARILMHLDYKGIPRGEEYFTFYLRNNPEPLHCLVMQRIEGLNLEEYIERRGNPIDQRLALTWLREIAEILQVVHQESFFHRDIKPSNIMLNPDGDLVLIDFGTAREVTGTYQAKFAGGQKVTGIISAGFTPPEQQNGHAEPRSDFFALGRTFVYLLTGKHPNVFYTPDIDDLRWREAAPQVNPAFADFIDRLMQRFPAQRPANPQEILQTLADLNPILYPPLKTRTVSPVPVPAAASALSAAPTSLPAVPIPPTQISPHPPSQSTPALLPSNWSRRKVIQIGGWIGAGIGVVALGHQLLRSQSDPERSAPDPRESPAPSNAAPSSAEASPGQPSPTPASAEASPSQPGVSSLPLETVSFETVTVNAKGEVTDRRSAEAKVFTEDLGNSVSLDMVQIPSGKFTMGSPVAEALRENSESPQHPVTLTSFFISKFVVTQAQYQAIMGSNPSRFKAMNRPVETVSWNDAVAFCQKLSQQTGRTYRLPTEAEWEYACRAGTTTPFHFGATLTPDLANYNSHDAYASGPTGEHQEQTTDVGSFPPNAFGLYDMHGNVWEWCQDVYHSSYQGAPTDGSAWTTGGEGGRLLRGGAWGLPPEVCRSAARDRHAADDLFEHHGFRVVLVADV